MQVVSLHPLDLDAVGRYVESLQHDEIESAWQDWYDPRLRGDITRLQNGDENAANRLTLGLAKALSHSGPLFIHQPFGLSFWEANVDRPIGMLMRPPSRIFQDVGVAAESVRAMPIRLDLQQGMMGGAYIPARLIHQALTLLDDHMERVVRRLVDAEYDPMATFGLMHEAMRYASARGVGLFEAMDVVGPEGQGMPGATVIMADRKRLDPDVRDRIEACLQQSKKPGLMRRLFGRGDPQVQPNGRHPGPG